jgi:phosphatidylglycerol:prolipoprotein diacylglycerol transferase
MFPSFEIGDRIISPYTILTIIAVISAGILGMRLSKKRGILDADMLIFMLVSSIGIFLGGPMLFGITRLIRNLEHLPQIFEQFGFFEVVVWIFSGSVFYGGLLGAMAVGFGFMKWKKLDKGAYTDVMALVAPFFHFFGRIGCFLGGCCYGRPWEHGFTYHYSLAEPANFIPRFPVQLLEAVWILAIFLLIFTLFNSEKHKNRLFLIYLITYSFGRFFIEFLRGDEIRGLYGTGGGISTSQVISVIVFTFSVLLLLRKTFFVKKSKKTIDNV